MELYTGAAVSIISNRTREIMFPRVKLTMSSLHLNLGELPVQVEYQ